MLAADLRHRVDALWDTVWASGVSNPLTATDYLSTVLLLRRLAVTADGTPSLRDAVAQGVEAGDADEVARLMVAVQTRFGVGVSPDVGAASTWRDLSTLRRVLAEVDDLDLTDRNHDILGDVFEYLLHHLSTAGHFGQFRTPRHLIRFLVDAVDPRPGEHVVDPACGTAGFLLATHEHRGDGPASGTEVDATMARIASTNLLVHGVSGTRVRHGDGLLTTDRDADVVLANPPFAGVVATDRARAFRSGAPRTELLFLELTLRRLLPGGRAGVIVPTGVLTSTTGPATWVRRQLLERQRLRAVVELPAGVFRPYTDVRTAVLLWSNEPPASDVLMVRVGADGYSLDDRRTAVDADDLPATLRLLAGHDSDVPHARVPVARLTEKDANLSPGRHLADPASPGTTAAPPLHEAIDAATNALADVEQGLARLTGLLR